MDDLRPVVPLETQVASGCCVPPSGLAAAPLFVPPPRPGRSYSASSGELVFKAIENGNGYVFEGETRFDRLFAGIATPKPAFMDRYERDHRGIEHIGAEDTLDGDYGRVLERAYRT